MLNNSIHLKFKIHILNSIVVLCYLYIGINDSLINHFINFLGQIKKKMN